MDTRINFFFFFFFRIGLFVKCNIFLLILAIFWLGKYGLEDKKNMILIISILMSLFLD